MLNNNKSQEFDKIEREESTEKEVGASSGYIPNEEAVADGEAKVYTCPSCGAEIVTDATTAATFCYYCHNPVILGGRLDGAYLPDKIIPFEIINSR